MLEETIQQAVTETQDTDSATDIDFGDLFTESTPEEATEASKSVSEPQEAAEESTPATVDEQKVVEADVKPNAEQTIKVKYNGKEQEIPISEAITLTQKGMNYEHVKSELDALKNAKEFSIIDKYAKANNMSREDYVAFAEKQAEQMELQQYQSAGMSEEQAKQAVERDKQAQVAIEKLALYEAKEAETAKWQKFFTEHPDVDSKAIPAEVAEQMKDPKCNPSEVYNAYENKILKEKIKSLEQTQKVKEKTVGSVIGDAPTDTKSDPFLDGLFG